MFSKDGWQSRFGGLLLSEAVFLGCHAFVLFPLYFCAFVLLFLCAIAYMLLPLCLCAFVPLCLCAFVLLFLFFAFAFWTSSFVLLPLFFCFSLHFNCAMRPILHLCIQFLEFARFPECMNITFQIPFCPLCFACLYKGHCFTSHAKCFTNLLQYIVAKCFT